MSECKYEIQTRFKIEINGPSSKEAYFQFDGYIPICIDGAIAHNRNLQGISVVILACNDISCQQKPLGNCRKLEEKIITKFRNSPYLTIVSIKKLEF